MFILSEQLSAEMSDTEIRNSIKIYFVARLLSSFMRRYRSGVLYKDGEVNKIHQRVEEFIFEVWQNRKVRVKENSYYEV